MSTTSLTATERGAAKAGNGKVSPDEDIQDDKDIKPIFLKGLFSVATTSTKSPSTLRNDIRQVLDRMQIRYRETRTGFDCIHMPSIDLSSFPVEQQTRHRKQETDSTAATVQASEDAPTPVPSSPPSKTLPPIPRDYAGSPTPPHAMYHTGELDEDVFESIGANRLSVRFEINIVKVPLLPLHGLQFRRASGDGWQYHMLARRVLTELKL